MHTEISLQKQILDHTVNEFDYNSHIFALISTDYQIDFIISTLLNQRNHNFHSAAIKLGNKWIKPLQNGFISLYEDLCMEMSLILYWSKKYTFYHD